MKYTKIDHLPYEFEFKTHVNELMENAIYHARRISDTEYNVTIGGNRWKFHRQDLIRDIEKGAYEITRIIHGEKPENEPLRTYKITRTEHLSGYFYVKATSEDEALEIFEKQILDGEVDFSDMELNDSENVAREINEKEIF